MIADKSDNETHSPIINFKAIEGLTDYFCPFCDQKLFRGKVNEFNMVCSSCNKLVRSSNIEDFKKTNQKDASLE
ncbi:MAG: hypothetical protein KKE44_00375 [Proteobacteria bacterium]|nr:hypothetical protein [Pseudomonadota bacterium]MBU1581182.1 hypothetical protein [Pseudomonadota bacterium]MBU2453911.1 hypothetical protein [Pseudomonadota bacterium]MBU2629863.1 hypothetical protein [Pseudomonadota bacterium]